MEAAWEITFSAGKEGILWEGSKYIESFCYIKLDAMLSVKANTGFNISNKEFNMEAAREITFPTGKEGILWEGSKYIESFGYIKLDAMQGVKAI